MAHKIYNGPLGRVEAWPEDDGDTRGVGFRALDRSARDWLSREDFAAQYEGEEQSSLAPPFWEDAK